MHIILFKLLATPLYPEGLVLMMLILSAVLLRLKQTKAARILAIIAASFTYAIFSPVFSGVLMRALEAPFNQEAAYTRCPAIVLLGSAAVPAAPPRRYHETNSQGDRILHAARLYKQGYAPRIVATGGKVPGARDYGSTDAKVCGSLLAELFCVPDSAIVLEEKARTTHEHGPLLDKLFRERGWNKEIILVTSASHMYRSVKVMQKAGFIVHPAPTDYQTDFGFHPGIYDFFPHPAAYQKVRSVVHELYGIIGYKVLGWI